MATRNDPVVERRLRPIYDFIDAGNYKKALQEVDRLLKKQKDCTCARVLKSLAMIRLNRLGEAKEILGAVHEESPTDDATLQAMILCYREIHRVDLIADAYKRAVAKEPNNEELLSHLFMSYVRLSDYKKQQDVAMALYKLVPKNPYFFWSVMSLYLQAITEEDEKKRSLLLTLAEKRVQKLVDEGKVEAEAEVDLFLMILEKQGKHEEILKVADGPLSKFIPNYLGFFTRRKALIYWKLNNYSKAFETLRELLDLHPDQLEFYEKLFDVALLTDTHEHDLTGSKKYVLDLVNLLKDFTSDQSPNYKLRGPHLAKIQLFYLLKSCETDHPSVHDLRSSIADNAAKLFLEYFQLFGSKPACYYDILYILTTFKQSRNDLNDIITELKSQFGGNWPDDLNEMSKQLFVLFLESIKEEQLVPVDEKLTNISDLFKRYFHCFPLTEQLLPTDAHPSDGHMLLVAHQLMDDSVVNEKLLTIAVVALVKCLESSPSNHAAKLLLMSLYSHIGAEAANQTLFNSLEIKYIQYDTLGYMATTSASSCGHFQTALNLYNNSLKFYNMNHKETTDFMISCYKYGAFTKVEEMMNMKSKLENSVQYVSTTLDRMFLDLIQNAKSVESVVELVRSFEMNPLKDRTDWDFLCDNRDFRSFGFNSLQAEKCIQETKKWTFDCEKRWLQVRSLIIRSIAAAFYSLEAKILNVDPFITNGTPDPVSPLRFIIDQLKEHQTALSVPANPSFIIWGAPTPRLVEFVKQPYVGLVIDTLEMVYSIEIDAKTHSEHVIVSFDQVVDYVIEKSKECKLLHHNLALLDTISHVVDCFGCICVILALTTNYYKVTNQGKKNKKRIKDLSLTGNSLPDLIEDVKKNLGHNINRLNNFLTNELKMSNRMDDSLLDKVSHVWERKDMERILGRVEEALDESYKKSLDEFTQMLTLYSKLVQSMVSK